MKNLNLEKLSEEELKKLLLDYENNIKIINDLIKQKQNKNKSRLDNYLETTSIFDFEFLVRSLSHIPSNNKKGPLTTEELFFLDEEGNELAKKYKVSNSKHLIELSINKYRGSFIHPILEDENYSRIIKKAQTLKILENVFQNEETQLNYEGAFITYRYIKNYLEKVLTEDNPDTDSNIVYKDFSKKIIIVTKNIQSIASELLELKKSIPNGKLAVSDQSLKTLVTKKSTSNFTSNQKLLTKCLAFGTTLEKLENKDYEDAKQLVYSQHI